MARPHSQEPSRRYKLTLPGAEAEALEDYARRVAKAPATVAALLVRQGIERVRSGDVDQAAERDRRIAKLEAERDGLRRQLHAQSQAAAGGADDRPRYEWPIDQLLGDEEWWSQWLPRLYEVLGSHLPRPSGGAMPVSPDQVPVDQRGYIDLLEWLLPTLIGEINWRSRAYPLQARRVGTPASADPDPLLSYRWEPVIRHVAEALCAFEYTADAAADPYTRMRLKAEITGPWLRVLLAIVDQEPPPELPLRGAGAVREGTAHPYTRR